MALLPSGLFARLFRRYDNGYASGVAGSTSDGSPFAFVCRHGAWEPDETPPPSGDVESVTVVEEGFAQVHAASYADADESAAWLRSTPTGVMMALVRPPAQQFYVLLDADGAHINNGDEPWAFGSTATPGPTATITGSRGGNAALADLLTKLDAKGVIVDGTSA